MTLLINIEAPSSIPKFRQIMAQIIEMTESGVLRPGTALPSSRTLADTIGVNRSTVYKAYQELWALGYIDSRPGSYSIIRTRTGRITRLKEPALPPVDLAERFTHVSRDLHDTCNTQRDHLGKASGQEIINFIPMSPDDRLMPVEPFRKCMNHVLATKGGTHLQYGETRGYAPLRESIAQRMQLHGISVGPDEIMVTSGIQNAMDILLKLLTAPGDRVVFESPTYPRAIELFRLYKTEMKGIAFPEEGMDLGEVEKTFTRKQPAMLYTIPNFQNPTGISTSHVHREKLLRLCETYKVPLVEDGFEEEMKYFGKVAMPIKSMDQRGVVVYLGTFSKVLFPALRIGWVAAPKSMIDHLVPIQRATVLSGNLLDQAALEYFCREGYYDRHIKRLHRIYRKRMQTAMTAMETISLRDISWTRPNGGYSFWVRLDNIDLPEHIVMDHLLDSGVAAAPGSTHFYKTPATPCFRLSIAHRNEAEITEGIKRLSNALRTIYRQHKNGTDT